MRRKMKILIAIFSFLTSLLSYAKSNKEAVPSIKLPKDHMVIGSEDDKAIPILMSGVTSIDHTGEVKFSALGKSEIEKICQDVIDSIDETN